MSHRRFRPLLLVSSIIAMLAIPDAAFAWKSDGDPVFARGPRNTIGYYAVGAATASEARDAVRPWNASGARIRLVPVRRAAAKIIVMPAMRDSMCFGVARTVTVNRVRRSSTIRRSTCRSRDDRVNILVHEFGHALGLEHEDGRCAAMNNHSVDGVPFKCADALDLPKWRFYCADLEADDIRGMVARYGGRARMPKQRICDRGPKPGTATSVGVSFGALQESGADTTFSWTHPKATTTQELRVDTNQGACAGHDEEWWGPGATVAIASEAAASHLVEGMGAGQWCLRLQAYDEWGQPGDPVLVDFTVPGTPFQPS